MADKNLYNEDSIQSLTPREHVQLRPGMYAGNTDTPNQLLLEVFSNALDEHNIGHGNIIYVQTKDDGVCFVEDKAQGFPIGQKREDGITILEAAFSVMNTSGKYTDDGVYEGTSLGLNGIGLKLVTFLSEWLEVVSYQNGKSEKLRFENGIIVDKKIDKVADKGSGTKVWFKPDKQYFKTDRVDNKFFEKFFNDICCLCNDLTIVFNDKEIHHSSIEDIISIKAGNNIEIVDNHFLIEDKDFKLAMTFTSSSMANIIPYVNYGLTDQGPHITSIKSTITRVFNNWAKQNGLLAAKDKNLDGNSIQEGILLVCNILSTGVKYDAQVKTRVVSLNSDFSSVLGEQLEIWLDNNPKDAEVIIEKALVARKAAEAAKKARAAVKAKATAKTKLKIAAMPSKLADCHNKDRSKCELYLTEGDSASGGCKIIRDASFQAILGLKGKVLNCLTSDIKKIQKNAEIVDIIKALGLQWGVDNSVIYDESKLRYDKLIIAADRDVDGAHIQSLICTMLWVLIPDIILDGHVYIALPPLYKAEWNKQYKYLDDKKALEDFKKDHKDFTLTYFKGLGEASPEELGGMIMNPKTRNIQQITVDDIGLAEKTINNLMGSDTQAKKEFVFGNKIKEIM